MANPVMTSLPLYVEQRRLPLIKEAVLSAKSASLMNLQTDIKYQAALNLLATDVELQDGSECGWTDSGSTTLSQRILTTGIIKVNQSFCDKNMLKYWTGYQVKVAAGQKTLPFEEDFTSLIVEKVKEKIEKLIWQGDTEATGATANDLKWFDGLIKILGEAEDVVEADSASGTSAYDAITKVYLAIPEKVLDKAVIFVGADLFRNFMVEMVAKNYYHYPADGMPSEEFILPGTNTKVIAVNGLNGTNTIVAADPMNLYYGCDMMNDEEKFDLWYSKDFNEFRLAIEFVAGVQIAWPNEVVKGVIATE